MNYNLRVIVVEDEQRIRAHITETLQRACPEVRLVAEAGNGADALKLAADLMPDVILTDIKMPVMDGLELARQLHMRYPKIIVVIISGFSEFELAQQAMRFGVFNYLLKPLEPDKLKDTFQDIQEEWLSSHSRRKRSFLLPEGVRTGQSGTDLLNHDRYLMCLVCIGNLCSVGYDAKLDDYFEDLFLHIDWDGVLGFDPSLTGWILSDEPAVNQKCLMIPHDPQNHINVLLFVQRLQKALRQTLVYSNVTICFTPAPVPRGEVWMTAQRLRHVIQNHLVLGGSGLFTADQPDPKEITELYNIARIRVESIIRSAIRTTNLQQLHIELQEVLDFAKDNHFPQKQYEKLFMHTFHILEFSMRRYDAGTVEKLMEQLKQELCLEMESETIDQLFFHCVDNFLKSQVPSMNKEEMQLALLKYVEDNYQTIENVEDLVSVFNYSYTYITRIFKQLTGVTVNKYITDKRITAAKKMFDCNPDISIKDAGNCVGYHDQHYFSRIFKQVCGISPKQYKAETLQDRDPAAARLKAGQDQLT